MIDLVYKNYTGQKALGEIFFRKILEIAVRELKLKENFGISVNLVSEAKIKELDRKYRNKNKPTDVLSFPLNDKSVVNCDLGDIFVCLSIAKKEAKSENVSTGRKLAQLTVHGFLHLLGYGHERSKKDEIKMFKLENKILKKCQDKGQFAA